MRERISRLQGSLPDDCDGALITSFVNRFYYTQIHSSAGLLLLTRREAVFLTDFRYIETAQRQADGFSARMLEDIPTALREEAKRLGITRLAVETSLSLADYFAYQKALGEETIVADKRLSEHMALQRSIKSPAEYALMQKAQDIADKSYAELLDFIQAGRTEREIATQLAYLARKNGAERESFATIAVSGANSSLPHGQPTDKPLAHGEFFTLDFGVIYKGYCSDMTRTVAIGQVSDEMHRVYDTVLMAQQKALDSIAVGVSFKDVDAAARDYIDAQGYVGCFGHGLGHSLGIQIHEEPRFSPKARGELRDGHVMSVEPGIYLAGRFGCRIEDVVYITGEGVVNLTSSPKQLLVL